jgi:hypothetical protein
MTQTCTATRYYLESPGFESRWDKIFLLSVRLQTSPGSRTVFSEMGTLGSFFGLRRPERDVTHQPPSRAAVENGYSEISTSFYERIGI